MAANTRIAKTVRRTHELNNERVAVLEVVPTVCASVVVELNPRSLQRLLKCLNFIHSNPETSSARLPFSLNEARVSARYDLSIVARCKV